MPPPVFGDEFNDDVFGPTQWDVIKGNPTVSDGKLMLSGGATRTEIQSKARFPSGILHLAIESSGWKSQHQTTDSSFGFEIWTGSNGQCHFAVVFIANGHLGVLRSQPDVNNNCSGDPEHQAFLPISNWDAVRAAGTIFLTLMWSPSGITLHLSDGGLNHGQTVYRAEANPPVSLKLRLNADMGETFEIGFLRLYGLEEQSILVDDFTPQPEQGKSFWFHNRLGGDRGAIEGPGSGNVIFGEGMVTAQINSGTDSLRGVWTALN
ncbi:MAG: hypothetical protein KDI79_20570, partial [Anaerolineae bacterium]|nr:hypothetical protein [Anaerolineae bacterium]